MRADGRAAVSVPVVHLVAEHAPSSIDGDALRCLLDDGLSTVYDYRLSCDVLRVVRGKEEDRLPDVLWGRQPLERILCAAWSWND